MQSQDKRPSRSEARPKPRCRELVLGVVACSNGRPFHFPVPCNKPSVCLDCRRYKAQNIYVPHARDVFPESVHVFGGEVDTSNHSRKGIHHLRITTAEGQTYFFSAPVAVA